MSERTSRSGRLIRSQQDFLAAVFLLLTSGIAFWQAMALPIGSLNAIGPGMMPAALALLLAVLSVVLLIDSFKEDGPEVSAPSLRGIVFILGAFIAFGLAVRPLGLVIAGPLAVVMSGLATSETRFGETLLFGIGMTAFCIGLFKVALGLPIPLAPWLLGY